MAASIPELNEYQAYDEQKYEALVVGGKFPLLPLNLHTSFGCYDNKEESSVGLFIH